MVPVIGAQISLREQRETEKTDEQTTSSKAQGQTRRNIQPSPNDGNYQPGDSALQSTLIVQTLTFEK